MDRFRNIFRGKENAQHQSSRSQGAVNSLNGFSGSNDTDYDGSVRTDGEGQAGDSNTLNAEGLLCPSCMTSFDDVESLQDHFSSAHAEDGVTHSSKTGEETLHEELYLIKMQLNASEESRLLQLKEFIELQRLIDTIKKEHTEALATLKDERHLCAQLRRSAATLRDDNDSLQQRLTEVTTAVSSLEAQLSDERLSRVEQLSDITLLDKWQKRAEDADKKLTAATEAAAEVAACLAVSEQARAVLDKRLLTCADAQSLLDQRLMASEEARSLLQQRLATSEETLVGIGERLTASEEAHLRASQHLATLEEQRARVGKQLADAEHEQTLLGRRLTTSEESQALLRGRLTSSEEMRALSDARLLDSNRLAAESRLKADGALVEMLKRHEENAAAEGRWRDESERMQRALMALEGRLGAAQARIEADERVRNAMLKVGEGEQALDDAMAQLRQENARLSEELENTERRCIQEKDRLWNECKERESESKQATEALLMKHEQTAAIASQCLAELERSSSIEAARHQAEVALLRREDVELNSQLTDLECRRQAEERCALEASDRAKAALKEASDKAEAALKESSEKAEAAIRETSEKAEAALKEASEKAEAALLKSDLVEKQLRAQVQSLEDASTQARAHADELRAQVVAAEAHLAECRLELESSRLRLSAREASLTVLEHQLAQLQEDNKEKQVVLNTSLTTATRDHKMVEQKLVEDLSNCGKELATTKESLNQALLATMAEAESVRRLTLEKESVCRQLEECRLSAGSASESLHSLGQKLHQYEEDLEQCQSDLRNVTAENIAWMDKYANLNKVLAESTKKLDAAREQVEVAAEESAKLRAELTLKTQQSQEADQKHKDAVQQLQDEAADRESSSLSKQAIHMQAQCDALLSEHVEAAERRLQQERVEAEHVRQRESSGLAEQLRAERLRAEETEVRSNMHVVSLSENLATVKTDLTATQEKLMDVVKHNDELRGMLLELEAKLDNSQEDRRVLLQRCLECEHENSRLKDDLSSLRHRLDEKEAALQELSRENQLLQIKASRAQSRKWTDDNEVTECSNCAKNFSVTVRRHHCRNCGDIFCGECSSQSAATASSRKPVRVCDVCYKDLGARAAALI